MGLNPEKRKYPRHNHISPMNMYRMDFQDEHFYAQMHDYSQGGLSMKTTEDLVIGQLVYLEMIDHEKTSKGPEKNKSYFGSVTWKDFDSMADGNGLYQYGIKYQESVH